MCWFTKHLRNVGIASVSMLFLLTCLALIPLTAASAHEEILRVATPTTTTVQLTPTVDATVAALNKEQLTQQVAEQQHTWDNWVWSNAATILSSFLSTLVIVIGALFGLWRWRRDQHAEREKRAEERFQAAVTGLGDEKEGARIGAAILLRTFLRPGYEQFYTQTFDLAVANLRLQRTAHPSTDPGVSLPLTTLSQTLSVVFKEAFPLARSQNEGNPQSLDASRVQLDSSYLEKADLKQVWMLRAFLREADLSEVDLSHANLSHANLSHAKLLEANLTKADLSYANLSQASFWEADLGYANLSGANLSMADLSYANLSGANLSMADLSMADLSYANLSGADLSYANLSMADLSYANLSMADLSYVENLENARALNGTDLQGAIELTKEQKAACKAKGAIVDEDPTASVSQSTLAPSSPPQSNNAQSPSAPSAQGSTLPPDPDGSNIVSSKPEPES